MWRPVALTVVGPDSAEDSTPNPFLDARMDVTFTQAGRSITVPGFFAADGAAADTSAAAGNRWRVYFTPDAAGPWEYRVSFWRGPGVAVADDPLAGSPVEGSDGLGGSFSVAEPLPDEPGMLRYAGGHHVRRAGSGEFFLKGGADSPENFLAFHEFDQTPPKHRYEPHVADFRAGDPTWQGGKGMGILGALNYLAGEGMNSVYFLTMNVGGDGRDVWPWTASAERERFDVSKLAQWERVFGHMDRLGLMLHAVLQETENDQLLDGGALGPQRRLYHRELVARFGHHLALTWNLGEENTNTQAQREAFARHLRTLDAYDHPIVVHSLGGPNGRESTFGPLLGFEALEGPSFQFGALEQDIHGETAGWVRRSAAAGRPWVVSLDEIGPAGEGVVPDAVDPGHDEVRHKALSANLMAGGAGVEWYFGYSHPHDDLDAEDWRSRAAMWAQTRHALEFFQAHLPFWRMQEADALTDTPSDYVLAAPGEVYAVYLPTPAPTALDLGAGTSTYAVDWYDPRGGGALQEGSTPTITGPGPREIGSPPAATGDWVALIRVASPAP